MARQTLTRKTTTLAALLVALQLLVPSALASVSSEVSAAYAPAGQKVAQIEHLISTATGTPPPLPLNPTQALIDATTALANAVGFPQSQIGQRIVQSGLSPEVAGRLAIVLENALVCRDVTAAKFAAVGGTSAPWLDILRNGGGLVEADFVAIRDCSGPLWAAVKALEKVLEGPVCVPLAASVDIWPVLYVDGSCAATNYRNDYLVIVDLGGHDTYDNNVGGNMVDFNWAPSTSLVSGLRGRGEAHGCQRAIPGLVNADCTPSVGVLLDMRGADTYGVLEEPDHDTGCTNDYVVRRLVTGGSGFLGVSIQRDAGAEGDWHTGKTGALGSGHVFGVGILSDKAGNDHYLAVRNSQGFALVGGVGILHDEGGSDTYDFYMPAPIDPNVPNQHEGAGGVRDDEGEGECDRIPRFLQGAANVFPGSIGILVEQSGNDNYRGAFEQAFEAPLSFDASAGSAGFGANGATGVFLDRAGTDAYTMVNELAVTGAAIRGNGVQSGGAAPVCDGSGPCTTSFGSNGGQGAFVDI